MDFYTVVAKKFHLMMILPHEFDKRTDFWLNGVWNNYKHFVSLILLAAYFLSCDFEKLMLYVLSHVECPHGKILNPVAIFKLLCVFCQKLLRLRRLLHHQNKYWQNVMLVKFLIGGHCFYPEIFVPLNQNGCPKIEPKVFRVKFVKKP